MNSSARQSSAVLWLFCLLLAQAGMAQHIPERSPRPGEQRLNRFQFKTTHNSFERDNGLLDRVSITDQLDRYDAWCVEFDLRWHSDNNDFYIFHDCADEAGNDTLNAFLTEINATHRRTTGVTFLYFDSGDIGPCFLYPNIVAKPANWMALLQTKLTSYFGNSVYTRNEFVADGSKWPSMQELLRRGKHIIPIVNSSDSSYLFGFTSGSSSVGFVNTPDANQTITAADLGDEFLSRWYPSSGWTCTLNNGDWTTAVTHNFTFPASNCSDMSDPRLHPPQTIYVGFPAATEAGRGTWLDAFVGPNACKNAINAATTHQVLKGASTVTIQSNAGIYSAPPRISAAVRLTSAGGTTRFQAQ